MSDNERMFAEPGGDWVLKDLNGRRYSSDDLLGNFYVLFFGNTLCPEATPYTVMKICKAMRKMNNSKEGQYIRCKAVFVTVKPEYDTKQRLLEFREMFDPRVNLIMLREKTNKEPNLLKMMRDFHVPVGLTPEEQERATAFFEQK